MFKNEENVTFPEVVSMLVFSLFYHYMKLLVERKFNSS